MKGDFVTVMPFHIKMMGDFVTVIPFHIKIKGDFVTYHFILKLRGIL